MAQVADRMPRVGLIPDSVSLENHRRIVEVAKKSGS